MEKFNRAERRAQTARLKAKRKSYWGYGRSYGTEPPEPMRPDQLGKVVQNPHPCSCLMGCANGRRFYGRTLKEVVQMIDLEEGIMSLH